MAGQTEYETLVRPIEQRMIRAVWRIVRDPDDFDDAFQEATGTIWKRLDKIRRHPNPQALILRICINAAYDVLRKKTRLRRREALEAIPEEFPDREPSALDRLISQGNQREIIQAIGQLPRNQAEAVLMRFAEEMSYPEIADALGCSEGAVRQHVSRGRVQLGQLLARFAPFSPGRS